jgi:Dolichyl-phosphate-mannose-protein mannosyltransferase
MAANTLDRAQPRAATVSPGGVRHSRSGRASALGMLLVFIAAFSAYWVSPVRAESDSFWVVMTARSLVKHGDVNLDEYAQLIKWNRSFQIERHDGHAYYAVPLGTSLAALPVVVMASIADGKDLDEHLANGDNQPWDGIAAALIAAATAAVVFAVARRLNDRVWIAYATAFVFAFGTQAWGIASRTMWMQGPSMLCLALGLLFALRALESPRWFAPLGAVLAMAYFVRPTNAIPLVVFGVWALTRGRASLLRFLVGAAVVASGFLVLDQMLYGMVLQPYFSASRLAITPTVVQALAAYLVSPSRGLFVFVPVSILAVIGYRDRLRKRTLTSLDVAVAITIVGYWIGVSCFPDWTGGWSYGPRFLADVAPLVVWFLPVTFELLARKRNVAMTLLATLVVVLSVTIQARGAFEQSTATWNWTPRFLDPGRVWDWSDPQFLA